TVISGGQKQGRSSLSSPSTTTKETEIGESGESIRLEPKEDQDTDEKESSQDSSATCPEESDDGIRFESVQNQDEHNEDESSQTSSSATEVSDDGICFERGDENQQDFVQLNRHQNQQETSWPSARSCGSEDITLSTEAERSQRLKKCTFTLYIQMELMELTLKVFINTRNNRYLEEGRSVLSEHDREIGMKIFLGLCRALEFVHEEGFIHRDIKPSNVLLSSKDSKKDSIFPECSHYVKLS
ncbi:unnamed protein product, partial [Cyprideis torosa]